MFVNNYTFAQMDKIVISMTIDKYIIMLTLLVINQPELYVRRVCLCSDSMMSFGHAHLFSEVGII